MSQLYLKGVYYDTDSGGLWYLNNTGSYIEINGSPATINEYIDSHTLDSTDLFAIIKMNSASANSLTLPADDNADIPIGSSGLVWQDGVGQTSFLADSGVTIKSESDKLNFTGQYAAATWIKVDADTYLVAGNLST